MIRSWIWRNGAKIPISFVAAALLSAENWSDFAHISFWFYFEGDIVAIKAENGARTCACQGIIAMIQYWFQFVASKMAEKSTPHDARCKRCGTCECHLLLSRLYWFDYSCWVSLVMIGKHKWLCRFVMRLSRGLDDIYHLMATHVCCSLHSWEACLQRSISPTFNNQSGEGHVGFSELALLGVFATTWKRWQTDGLSTCLASLKAFRRFSAAKQVLSHLAGNALLETATLLQLAS